MYVPLHVKSECSLGYGVVAVEDLVARAAELGLPALALTDLENLYAQVLHHAACRAHGIKPLTGVELRPGFDGLRRLGGRAGRLVLLARDALGYESLCRIISRRRLAAGPRGPGILGEDPLPLVAEEAVGLNVLTDDVTTLERLVACGSFARAQLGLLLVRPGRSRDEERRICAAARRHHVALLADPDVVFLRREQRSLHPLVVAIRQHRRLDEVQQHREIESEERLLRSVAEVERLYADVPEAVAATLQVAESCTLQLGAAPHVLPHLELPGGESPSAALRRICQRALEAAPRPARAGGESYARRLSRELEVIDQLGLAAYFLIVGEIVELARRRGVAVVGRGSAGSSLVVHLLGASPVDPLVHDLYFERFLHPRKSDWPDIDLDFPSRQRDAVIDRVYERFGRERVATVATLSRFQVRSGLREGLKAWGAPLDVIDSLLRALPPDELLVEAVDFVGDAAADARARPRTLPPAAARCRAAWPLLQQLLGRPRHIGTHPGGLVIADRPLTAYAPLELAPKGVVITQYDAESATRLGLVKIDLLGNRALDEIEETIQLRLRSTASGAPNTKTRPPMLRSIAADGWEAIPWDDPAALALIDRAETVGCFQLESPAMRSLLARLPIRTLGDVIAAVALVRPGPSAGDAKSAFIRRARGEEPDPAIDPRLVGRLGPTHGVLLYEEDVMALLSASANLSLAEADELRAAIVHAGDDDAALAGLEAGFLGRGGAPRDWAAAVRFAAYSFNKAHAVSYGQLGYVTALLKAHFPVELCCALLNHHEGLYPPRTIVGDLQRRGVRVLPPDVERSGYASRIEGDAVRVGLHAISSLPHPTATALVRDRGERGPFGTLRRLLARVPLRGRPLVAVVLSGACDSLAPLSAETYPFAHEAELRRLSEGPLALALEPSPAPPPAVDPQRLDTYRALVRIRNELRFLGLHLHAHPMAVLRGEAERYGCLPVSEAATRLGARVRVAGTAAALRRFPTRRGVMAFLTLEDETGILEAVAFAGAQQRVVGGRVTTPGPFFAQGTIRDDRGGVYLEMDRLEPFFARERPYGAS